MTPFDALAALILSTCPEGYNAATLRAELDEGYAELDLRCRNPRGEEIRSIFPGDSSMRLHLALDEIRTEMARTSGEPWERCVFELSADGRFQFNVEYPDRDRST